MASSSSMACLFFYLVLLYMGFGFSSAAVLKVGDAVGWTILKIDYASWASKKTFHVGDTLLFEYNNTFHNVMEVNKADYDACNSKAPMATYTTGKDSIPIKSAGDHFYLCGFPGHCPAGQKLKITALAKGSSAAPSTAPAGAPSMSHAPGGAAAASPTESPTAPNAKSAAVACKGVGMAVSALAVAAGFMVMAY